MAKQGACGALCTLVLGGLIIGFGIPYTIESYEYRNQPQYLWYWCVIALVIEIISTVNFIYKLMRPDKINITEVITEKKHMAIVEVAKQSDVLDQAIFLAWFGMTIWGCVIYDRDKHNPSYPEHIWTWFSVLFIFFLSIFSCIGCLCCCAICGAICGGASNTRQQV